MPQFTGVILGFDPGGRARGKGAFGWSVCSVVDRELRSPSRTGVAKDALEALRETRTAADSLDGCQAVLAAGIDAPLCWGRRGGRAVDDLVRQALSDSGFSTPSGTVQQVNSLRGACLVQGVLLAKYLDETWNLKITETHPKALYHLLEQSGSSRLLVMVKEFTKGLSGHERDATLAAIAAWAMYLRLPGWRNLYDEEADLAQPFDTPVSYWMPIS